MRERQHRKMASWKEGGVPMISFHVEFDAMTFEEPPGGPFMFRRQWAARAMACKGKRLADLTEDDRFALAVSAGVRFHIRLNENHTRYVIVTEPCGIAEDGRGGFIVATKAGMEKHLSSKL